MNEQLSLFPQKSQFVRSSPGLVMGKEAMNGWKSRIFKYQQQTKARKPPQQISLFELDVPSAHCDLHTLDPFDLSPQSLNFWRMPSWEGEACLYFVIDHVMPLLLYIGETKRTPTERWQGVHDCKDYLRRYHALHCQYELKRAVSISFCWDVPTERKARQELESELIYKWRSPFNKECWQYWGQPFGKF